MKDHEFTSALKQCAAEARAKQSDHMGEDKAHSACPYCWAMARLIQASDDAAEAVATYQQKEKK